jgi:hypothetical protein
MIKKAFEQILEKNYPADLHKKVMRKAWFLKYQKILFAGAAAAVVYTAVSAFMLYTEMMEIEFFDIIRTLFTNIGFNLELIADAVRTSLALAPAGYIMNSLASLVLITFSAYIFKKMYRPYYNN